MRHTRRLERMEQRMGDMGGDRPWWYDLEDHVEQGPACYFLGAAVDGLRSHYGLEPIDAVRRGWAGLEPLDDGREDKIAALTGHEINARAAELGWPRIPLGDVVEDATHGYIWSKHRRPILCLAFVVLVATATEEETATANAVVLGWERTPDA